MPLSSDQSPLNYSLEYRYENPEKPHQATRIGGYYYAYDANGNLAVESGEIPIAASGAGAAPQMTRQGDVRIVEEAWGYDHQKDETAGGYRRDFSWDSENRLKEVKSGSKITRFLYDAAGERTGKIGERGETLYFNAWFTSREDGALYRNSKHIFVGSHRAVTRLNADTGGTWEAEDLTTYYYHHDHLGSVSVVSDRHGDPYERIEYTPYGEMWKEVRHDGNTAASKYIPYRFTAKEWDEETGLYYHGARYYEPRLSRWISADPAGFSLSHPMNARGEPRRGYSIVEAANWYSYVSNNPVKYVDPTGDRGLTQREIQDIDTILGNQTPNFNQINIEDRRATPAEYRNASRGMNINTRNYNEKYLINNSGEYGLSLPGGNVFLPKKDSKGRPVRKSTNGQRALLVHEIYHQVQYESGQSPESVLNILVGEAIDKMHGSSNPYEYRDNFDDRDGDGFINRLSDILTLEGQAQYIKDFARRYFDERDAGGQYNPDTVDAAQVLRDSGIDSPAVRDVLGGP